MLIKVLIALAVAYGVLTFGGYLVVGQVAHRYMQIA
jgi:hypothetical protein